MPRGLRYDSYREAQAWAMVDGVKDALAFVCPDPEQAWIDMLSDAGHSVKA